MGSTDLEKEKSWDLHKLPIPRKRPLCLRILLVTIIIFQIIIFLQHMSSSHNPLKHAQQISLVSACMDREFTLPVAMKSWLDARGVEEVIIVDWSSDIPIHEKFPDLFQDPRIKLITVQDEPGWILSWAFNLGARHVTPGYKLMKVDCDTFIAVDFFEKHPLTDGIYYAGDWRVAVTENGKHLNGVFYLKQSDFAQINGFDERLHTYGWDDSDIFDRFNRSGLELKHFDQSTIFHIDHPDNLRYKKQKNLINLLFQTQKNRILSEQLPKWTSNDTFTQFDLKKGSTYSGISNHFIAKRKWTVPSLEKLVTPEQLEKAQKGAAEIVLRGYGISWETLGQLSASYLMKLIPTYTGNAERRMIVLHAQHGLSNRLRALAAGLAIARKTNRHFRLIWNLDEHVNAKFEDLFTNELDVWTDVELAEFRGENFDRYNYMDMEPGSNKNERIRVESTNHIYVRSAYILNCPEVTQADVEAALASLTPVKAVLDMVPKQKLTGAIGVHMRNKDPKVEIPGLADNTYTGTGWELLTKYRKMSGLLPFSTEIDALLEKSPNQIFYVSSDTEELKTQIKEKYGDRVIMMDTGGCLDRSTKCQQYALADLWALGQTDRILGSFWSSYSEVAGMLTKGKATYAGVDFPDWPSSHIIADQFKEKGNGIIYANYHSKENFGSGEASWVGWQTTELVNSAHSITAIMRSRLPIYAYVDRPEAIPEEDKKRFSRIILANNTLTLKKEVVSKLLAKSPSPARPVNLGKLKALASSPFAITLYLDTDTFLCSKLPDFDKVMGDREILFAKDTHVPSKSRWAWNSGVILFKNTPAVQDFFQLWEEIYLNDCILTGSSKSDMCALTTALERSPKLRYGVLDPTYNARIGHEDWQDIEGKVQKLRSPLLNGPVRILHTTRVVAYQSDDTCDILNAEDEVKYISNWLLFLFF